MDHTYASAMISAQKTHKRKAADWYPTPPDVTEALMRFLQLGRDTAVWEPASGNGAMARIIERHCEHVWPTDLRTDADIYGEPGRDFLVCESPHGFVADWIITNPPFNLSEAFIRKALSITPNVAMLLKSQYWHAARRLALFEEHQPSHVLPLTWRPAFLEAERGRSPLMDVVWVVWRGQAKLTEYLPLARPKDVTPLTQLFDDLLGGSTKSTLDPGMEDIL